MKRITKWPYRHQKGVVAIIVGLCIVVLIGFLGLVIDLGRLFITKTELSNAADACALAAAFELTGETDSLDKAESAGITVGQRNKVDFQGSNVIVQPDSDVTFSDHLNGTYLIKSSIAAASIPNMKYAKCTLPQNGIMPWFMQVMGFGAQSVISHAVAAQTPAQTTCAIPIGLCKFPTDHPTCTQGVQDSKGFCKGDWYRSRFTSGGGFTGSFNLIDYTPPSGGASELAAQLTGTGECNLEILTGPGSPTVGQTGMQQSIAKAWNTRFGLYQGSDTPITAPPDGTGFAYTPTSWPSQFNAYDGPTPSGTTALNFTTARANPNYLAYQGDLAAGLNLSGNPSSATWDDFKRNSTKKRRLALMPIVDCSAWGGSQTVPIERFACVLLLHPMQGPGEDLAIEYRGFADETDSPCASLGTPGTIGGVGPKVPALVR